MVGVKDSQYQEQKEKITDMIKKGIIKRTKSEQGSEWGSMKSDQIDKTKEPKRGDTSSIKSVEWRLDGMSSSTTRLRRKKKKKGTKSNRSNSRRGSDQDMSEKADNDNRSSISP